MSAIRRVLTAVAATCMLLTPFAAVADDPVYAEYWAGHRPVEVAIEEDQIVIRRAGGSDSDEDDDNGDGDGDGDGDDKGD